MKTRHAMALAGLAAVLGLTTTLALSKKKPAPPTPPAPVGAVAVDYSVGNPPCRYDWVNNPPTIRFDPGEPYVTVQSAQVRLRLRRPVVSPWTYKPTGTTYWISSAGADTNDGKSVRFPFATIAWAMSHVVTPGDCVYVLPGTYSELPYDPALTAALPSGTATKPIILSCAPVANGGGLGTVTLRFPDSALTGASIDLVPLRSYFTLNGLLLEGAKGRPGAPGGFTAQRYQNAVSPRGTGARVTNCILYNHVNCGIVGDGPATTASGNVIFANGLVGQDHGIYANGPRWTSAGNIVFSNAGAGIHYYTGDLANPVDYATITRNLSFGNGTQGLLLAGAFGTVTHNTSAYNGQNGFYYYSKGCQHNQVARNIFAFGGDRDDNADQGQAANNSDNNNDAFGPGGAVGAGGYAPAIVQGAGDISADPKFTAPLTGDFTLQAGSPAAGMGCYP